MSHPGGLSRCVLPVPKLGAPSLSFERPAVVVTGRGCKGALRRPQTPKHPALLPTDTPQPHAQKITPGRILLWAPEAGRAAGKPVTDWTEGGGRRGCGEPSGPQGPPGNPASATRGVWLQFLPQPGDSKWLSRRRRASQGPQLIGPAASCEATREGVKSEKVWDQEAGSPHSTEGLYLGAGGGVPRRAVSLTLSLGKSTPPPQRQAGSGESRASDAAQGLLSNKRPGTRASGNGAGRRKGGRPAWSPQFWELAAGVGGEVSVIPEFPLSSSES